jgi:SEC-C motif-containing protein
MSLAEPTAPLATAPWRRGLVRAARTGRQVGGGAAVSAPPQWCPCRPPQQRVAYPDCCGRYHRGAQHGAAPTPELLMRSRYSAFVLGEWDYLRQTWHPSTRPAAVDSAAAGLRWLGLEVRGQAHTDADHATVEFVARSKLAGRAHRLHETSRFIRVEGRWYYVDAQ